MLRMHHIPIISIYLVIITCIVYRNLKKNKKNIEILIISICSIFLFFYYSKSLLPFPIEKGTISLFKETSHNVIEIIPFKFIYNVYLYNSWKEILSYIMNRAICLVPVGLILGYFYSKNLYIKKYIISLLIPLTSIIIKIIFSIVFQYIYKNITFDDIFIETICILIGINIFKICSTFIFKKGKSFKIERV